MKKIKQKIKNVILSISYGQILGLFTVFFGFFLKHFFFLLKSDTFSENVISKMSSAKEQTKTLKVY